MNADTELGELFAKAEAELNDVANKYGFTVRLVESINGTWYFFPEVSAEWVGEIARAEREEDDGEWERGG